MPKAVPDRGTQFVGQSVNAQGNEFALRKQEPGRVFTRRRGADRPEGTSDPRFVTGVNPLPSVTGDVYLPRA